MAELQVLFWFIILPILIALLTIGVGTAINFIPAFYGAKLLTRKSFTGRKVVFFCCFILFAIAIHLNIRIPGIISDLLLPNESYVINETISANVGDEIFVGLNEGSVQFKSSYLASPWLDDYGNSISKPAIKSDHFIEHLKNRGLKIQRQQDKPIKIIGSIDKTATHNSIHIKVMKNNREIASYSNTFRVAFAGDQSNSSGVRLLMTIMQSTPTRLLFPDFWAQMLESNKPQEVPITNFFDRVFRVSPKPEQLAVSNYSVVSFEKTKNDRILSKEELTTWRDACNTGNRRVRVIGRRVKNQEKLLDQKWQSTGAWVDFFEDNKLVNRKYLQAPSIGKYASYWTHRTTCDSEYVNVAVSFIGIGMTQPEWLATLPKMKIHGARTPEETKKFGAEMKRVNGIIGKQRQESMRNIWILSYNLNDGSLKNAVNFTLPANAPFYFDSMAKTEPNEWRLTGFDLAEWKNSGSTNRYRENDYLIIVRKE